MDRINEEFKLLKAKYNKTSLPCQYASAMLYSLLDIGDEAFVRQHPDYKRVVTTIDVSNYESFSLYLTDDEKIALFKSGYREGKEFLEKFNWHDYKEFRKKMAGEESFYSETNDDV